MRSLIVATAFLGALFCGCSTTNPSAELIITPGSAGTVEVNGPTQFTATLVNSTADVTWTVTGGELSSASGLHVVYTPPPGTATASLTAKAGDLMTVVQIASAPTTLTAKSIPGLTAPVSVQYDAQDIPHINCAAIVDCIAVQGYVQARDRLFPMDFLRHVAEAKLAEMIGLDGLSQDVQLRTIFTTRAGHRLADDLVAAQDATTMTLLTAFAAGVNAYLAELRTTPGARLPAEYAQLPFALTATDIDDWSPKDTLALGRLQQFQLSETLNEETAFGQFASVYGPGGTHQDLGKVNAWIRAAAPPTEHGHTLSATASFAAATPAKVRRPANLRKWKHALDATAAVAASLHDRLRPLDATVGSNNWVVSAAKSATHVAMVANDPHLSLQYPPLFHLAAMTSSKASDNLDLTGGSFPGVPGALVGRGKHVGWGVTVVGYDVTDLYLERFALQTDCPGGNAGPPCVMFKGVKVSTIPAGDPAGGPQKYRVRIATGLVDANTILPADKRPPPFVFVVPHHGPIVSADLAKGTAVSVRWTGHEGNTHDTRAFLGLNTATDVDSAMVALKDFATGAQNFVLADDQGHIAYDPHALVPVRTFTEGASPKMPWFPLRGDDGNAEWGDGVSDCASATLTPLPATCWIADSALPQGKDPAKGYYFTANADPTSPSVSDGNDPLALPPYMSFAWDDSTGFRATRIEQMLEAAIAAHGSVSLADMQAIQSDHVSRPGMAFAPFIAAASAAGAPADLTAAKAVLAQWATNGFDCPSGLLGTDPKLSPVDPNVTVVQNSSGCFLFHAFLRVLFTNVFTDDLAVASQGVNGLAALKAMLFLLGLPDGAPGTSFCNDVDGKGTKVTDHTCGAQVATALAQAYGLLVAHVGPKPSDWVWGRAHTIKPVSLLALVTTDFSPGPYARPGGAFTVDVGSPSLSGPGLDFPYGSGGNVRHISLMDPAKPVVKMQLPGPERDGPAVFVGPDLLGQWVKNSYFDFAAGDQITAAAVSAQTFTAR